MKLTGKITTSGDDDRIDDDRIDGDDGFNYYDIYDFDFEKEMIMKELIIDRIAVENDVIIY